MLCNSDDGLCSKAKTEIHMGVFWETFKQLNSRIIFGGCFLKKKKKKKEEENDAQ